MEILFNALPQGVQDNISAETIQETWEEEVDKLGGLPKNLPRMCPAMCRNTLTKSVLNLSFLVTKAISKYSSTISRMAAFTTMLSGRRNKMRKRGIFMSDLVIETKKLTKITGNKLPLIL